jgi:ribosomal protein S18 acetylase RimI-like enzyme
MCCQKKISGVIVMNDVRIAPMQRQHLDAIVHLHISSFPSFFLTFLGPRFLRLLYDEVLATPESVALVALDYEQVIGFVVGVTHQSSFYGQLIRRRLLAFAYASLGAAIRRPSIIPRLFRALANSWSSKEAVAEALLMSIAVAPDAAGRGIGQLLVKAFLSDMQAKGIDSVSLTTDRDNNDRTNRFYRKLGFELARIYVTPEGRAMNEYFIRLYGSASE